MSNNEAVKKMTGVMASFIGHTAKHLPDDVLARLHEMQAAEDNPRALRFYEKHGFRRLSHERGRFGKLYLMEYRFGESHV